MLVSLIMALDASMIMRTLGPKICSLELTESGADYCRVGASISEPGRSGWSFAFIYLFICFRY